MLILKDNYPARVIAARIDGKFREELAGYLYSGLRYHVGNYIDIEKFFRITMTPPYLLVRVTLWRSIQTERPYDGLF